MRKALDAFNSSDPCFPLLNSQAIVNDFNILGHFNDADFNQWCVAPTFSQQVKTH